MKMHCLFLNVRFNKQVMDRCMLEMRSCLRNKENKGRLSYLKEARDRLHTLQTKADQIIHSLKRQLSTEIGKVTQGIEVMHFHRIIYCTFISRPAKYLFLQQGVQDKQVRLNCNTSNLKFKAR